MRSGGIHIRGEYNESDIKEIYNSYPTHFSINLHHGGYFTSSPGRKYVNGILTYVDFLETDNFGTYELEQIKQELGYVDGVPTYFHFLKPGCDLDNGIHTLVNDSDVSDLIGYVNTESRFVDVYVERGDTNIHQMGLALGWHDTSSDGKNSEDDDSDFGIDEDNDMDESEVDMRGFKCHVDDYDDLHHDYTNIEVLDNDNFESGSDFDEDIGSIRKKKLKYITRANGDDNSFFVGKLFGSREEVKKFLRKHTVETRRQLKIIKDDKERVRVVCAGDLATGVRVETKSIGVDETAKVTSMGGSKQKSNGGRGKKRNPDQYLCPWVLLVSKDHVSDTWMVKTYIADHKCLQSRSIKACTSTFLATQLIDQIEENPNIPVNAVREQFQRKYEVSVSTMKAFRARSKAQLHLHGDYSSQYGLLRDYIDELIRTNPCTTVKLDVELVADPTNTTRRFKRIYICLGSLKEGFKAIGRELLGLDGAFMKGPYPGQILTAVGIDPNNGIYPVTYAIVESENFNSWMWFLNCLGDDLNLGTNSNFTFVSDRQKGILQAITRLFPCAEHRFCLRHIHENMKLSFKGKAYKDILWKLATTTTVLQFERTMEELKKMNTNAHLWLSKIHPKHWSRSHFSGRAHSDVLLNNMCEVLNAKLLNGRDKAIIVALEYIREYLMRPIVNVLQVIDKCDGILTPTATKLFETIKKEATKYQVSWNGGEHYEVRWNGGGGDQCVVDVTQKTCTCRRWEITGMPCKHAVATIWNMSNYGKNVEIPESWVHAVYKLETWKNVYSFKIFPINGKSLWPKSRVPTTIIPPTHHKQVGRPKKKRKKI